MTTPERPAAAPSPGAVDVVTVGESLALLMGEAASPLRVGSPMRFSFAGAESNVSIGLARLGHTVAYVTCVGADWSGRLITESLRGEGVDVRHVRTAESVPTALMLRQHRTADTLTVAYYRDGLAGSQLAAADVPVEVVRSARIVHTTGITIGLSPGSRAAALAAIDAAAAAGVMVSLDVNHRAKLWSVDEAGATLAPLLAKVDLVFGGDEELLLLARRDDENVDAAVESILAGHPAVVVRKQGGQGATAYGAFGTIHVPAVPVCAVDPVGAGDAFVAGFLSGLLDGLDPQGCLERAAECGAFVVATRGDWEGAPTRDELGLLAGAEQVHR